MHRAQVPPPHCRARLAAVSARRRQPRAPPPCCAIAESSKCLTASLAGPSPRRRLAELGAKQVINGGTSGNAYHLATLSATVGPRAAQPRIRRVQAALPRAHHKQRAPGGICTGQYQACMPCCAACGACCVYDEHLRCPLCRAFVVSVAKFGISYAYLLRCTR